MDVEDWVVKIEQTMESQLLSQAEVARMARISRQRVNHVLKRKTRSLPTIRAICLALRLLPQRFPRAKG